MGPLSLTLLQDDSAPNQFARDDHFDEGAAVPHDIEASNQQPETANETADGHDLDLQAAEVEGEGEGEGEGDYDQEPGANGDYNNTGFDGTNMNPMQMQMMMMQNGMNPAAFSGFPMMGKSN